MSWMLVCDRPDNGQLKALLLAVLNFTALLIEYSFSRHLYSSIEVLQSSCVPYECHLSSVLSLTLRVLACFCLQHLTTLLASCDMQVVLSVLNLLYVFSKRSNYITRLGSDKRSPLLARLQHLAEVRASQAQGNTVEDLVQTCVYSAHSGFSSPILFRGEKVVFLHLLCLLCMFPNLSIELGREGEWLWPG